MARDPQARGYHTVQPYLYVRGAAAALAFYQTAFGGVERMRLPGPDGRIGHAEIQIGDSVVLLADEAPARGVSSPSTLGGSSCSLLLYVPDCDAAYRRALEAGAKSMREPADQFYGDRMAGVEDPFGFQWFLATHIKDVSLEEMRTITGQG